VLDNTIVADIAEAGDKIVLDFTIGQVVKIAIA
jgi:hypothetical protein